METLRSSGGILGNTTGSMPVPITVSSQRFYFAVYPMPKEQGETVEPIFLVDKSRAWLKHADKRSLEDSLKFLRKNLGSK